MATYDRNIASRLVNDLMRDFGMTRAQASGVAGNLAYESGGFKTLQERGYQRYGKNARGGYGYAQWTGPRRREYESWVEEKGLDPTSYEANYGFVKHELQNKEKGALNKILNTKTAQEAALATRKYYERPGVHADNKRIAMSQDIYNSAQDQPQIELASLPEPQTRPDLDTQLGYQAGGILAPETAGSFSPVSTANAGEMPQGGVLAPQAQSAPSAGMLADQYAQYRPATATQSTADYVAEQQAKIAANELSQAPQANNFDARFNAPQVQAGVDYTKAAPVAPQGLLAQPDPQATASVSPQVANNPESMSPEEYAAYQEDLAMAQPLEVPQAPLSATPVTAYVPTAQPMASPFDTAPMAPTSNQSFKAPPPPSGNDVWNGQAMSGVANGGYELNRQANGDVYRYSPQYDRTDILDASGQYKGQQKGRIDGPLTDTIETTPSFSNPVDEPKTKVGSLVRGGLGSMAGGLAAGVLGGPMAGLLGAAIGKNLAQGKGLLGDQVTQTQGVAANVFPTAPANNATNNNARSSYDEARSRGFSDKVAGAAFSGQGGLF